MKDGIRSVGTKDSVSSDCRLCMGDACRPDWEPYSGRIGDLPPEAFVSGACLTGKLRPNRLLSETTIIVSIVWSRLDRLQ